MDRRSCRRARPKRWLPDRRCAFWETKTQRGRLSDDQKAIIERLQALGHLWAVVRSIDERGERYVWLEPKFVDRLGAMRGPGESY